MLAGHTDAVSAVPFGRDGRTLVTGGQDATARVWDLDVASWRTRRCALAGRNLRSAEWKEFLPQRPYRRTCSSPAPTATPR